MNLLRSSSPRFAVLGAILALFGACAVGPNFVRPTPSDADGYTHAVLPAATIAADGRAQQFASDTALVADWWRLFGSEPLDAVVRKSLANNPTLEASEASLRQSQDTVRAGYGVFFPKIESDLGATRERSASSQQ